MGEEVREGPRNNIGRLSTVSPHPDTKRKEVEAFVSLAGNPPQPIFRSPNYDSAHLLGLETCKIVYRNHNGPYMDTQMTSNHVLEICFIASTAAIHLSGAQGEPMPYFRRWRMMYHYAPMALLILNFKLVVAPVKSLQVEALRGIPGAS